MCTLLQLSCLHCTTIYSSPCLIHLLNSVCVCRYVRACVRACASQVYVCAVCMSECMLSLLCAVYCISKDVSVEVQFTNKTTLATLPVNKIAYTINSQCITVFHCYWLNVVFQYNACMQGVIECSFCYWWKNFRNSLNDVNQ